MSGKNIFIMILGVIAVAGIVFLTIQEKQKPKEKVGIALKLKNGEHHELKMTNIQQTIMTYKDRMFKIQSSIKENVAFDVTSVEPNGTMNIVFYYKSVMLDANSPKDKISYDSSKPAVESNDPLNTAMAEVASAFLNGKLSFRINSYGEKKEIQGFDIIRKKMVDQIKKNAEKSINDPNMSEKDKEAMAALNKLFMEKLIKEKISFCNNLFTSMADDTRESINSIFMKYPYTEVSSGSKWYGKSWLNPGMSIDANDTYIFKRRENGAVYIDSISVVDMHKKSRVIEANAREIISKYISGAKSAANVINADTGLLQKSEAVHKFTGLQHVETDKSVLPIRPNMDIPVKMEATTIIELVK